MGATTSNDTPPAPPRGPTLRARPVPGSRLTRTRRRRRRPSVGHLFVGPYLLLLFGFGIGPGLYTFVLTFTRLRNGLPDLTTVGLQNYRRVLGDFRLGKVFGNLAKFLIYSVPIGVLLVVLLALLLHSKKGPYHSALRTAFFVPAATTGVPAVLLTIIMLDPRISPFGPLLRRMGFDAPSDVLVGANLPAVFTVIGFFVGAGLWISIFYGALSGISSTVTDAAQVDGARPWQVGWYVKRPYLHPYISYMLVLVFAGNVQLFAEPELLRSSLIAPVPATWSPNQLAYEFAFGLGDLGASAVLSLIMLSIGGVAAALILRMTDFFRIDA